MCIRDRVQSTLPAGVIGYADDLTLFIGESGAQRAARRVTQLIGKTRMQVRVEKCSILVGAGRADTVTPARDSSFFQIYDTGITVL